MADEIKGAKERSVAYPSIPLKDAVDNAAKLRESLGKGPYSRDQAAKALGHPNLSGPAARKVAALVHFGLLERKGNVYLQTQLAQDIVRPLDEEQKNRSIKVAATTPRLFEKLCQRYGGQALPTMLENILERDGVSSSATREVARIFKESFEYAGLLENGVVAIASDSEPSNVPTSPAASAPVRVAPTAALSPDQFVFDFAGGIKLFVPRTTKTSEAIADGELKDARAALTDFSKRFMGEEPAA